jgi:hypothetical protein
VLRTSRKGRIRHDRRPERNCADSETTDVPGTVSWTHTAPRRALEENILRDQTWIRAEAETKEMAQRRIVRREEGDDVWKKGDSGWRMSDNGEN